MSIDNDELSRLSGEEHYARGPRMNYIKLRLNGNTGKFNKSIPSDNKDERPTKEEVGDLVKGTIIRIRRRLTDFTNNYYTNEHDNSKQHVLLYEDGRQIDEGDYAYLREKYQGLRTEQTLYTLIGNEVYRFVVAGASLGSQDKPKDSIPLYDYIGSFDKEKGEHIWQYETDFTPKPEEGKLGKYYAISFSRGRKLNDSEMEVVSEKLKVLAPQIASMDSAIAFKTPVSHQPKPVDPSAQPEPADELPTIQVEDDYASTGGINVDDIPF